MKIILLIFFPCLLFAQDTTCIKTQRLARIADTLHHYKQFKPAYQTCDSLLSDSYELSATLREEITQHKHKVSILQNSLKLKGEEAFTWQQTAGLHKKHNENLTKSLEKARKARKGWTIGGMTAAGAAIAGLVTTILILK